MTILNQRITLGNKNNMKKKVIKNMDVKENILAIICYAVALGMGIVSIVLSIMGEPVDVILLGIGVAALGLAGLDSIDKE